jgi:undecaprenyl-diphosphatase
MRRIDSKTQAAFVHALPRMLGAAVALLLLGIALGMAAKHGAVPFDRTVTQHLSKLSRSHPALRVSMEVVTFLGSSAWLVAVVTVSTIVLIVRRAVATAVGLVLCTGVGAALTTALKLIVDRPRPPFALVQATGLSFPSGHAMNSSIVYGAIVLLLGATVRPRRATEAQRVATVMIALIACSRLALGVHYLSDVVGGITLGAVWLALTNQHFVRRVRHFV